jgi:hypothetical protein
MNLIQKLSTASLLSTSLAGASGCAAVTAGATLWNAHETSRIADSLENRNQNLYKKNQPKNKNKFVIAGAYKGDLNNNNRCEDEEFEKFGEKVFNKDEEINVYCEIFNRNRAKLITIVHNKDNKEVYKNIIDIYNKKDIHGGIGHKDCITKIPVGNYTYIHKIGNEILSEINFSIIE